MSPTFFTSIIGLVITVLALGGVGPSIYASIAANKVGLGSGREDLLTQQVVRFKASEGVFPADMADLINKGYWSAADNDNGFGGTYSFAVDAAKNQVSISTVIADPVARAQYLSRKRVFSPIQGANGLVSTTVVLPGGGTSGSPVASAGSILVASAAPNPANANYWYDTSGASPVLRVHDGTNWVKTDAGVSSSGSGGVPPPSTSNIVTSTAALPASATVGDVKYVYDSANSSLQTMYFYNGGWLKAGSGENQPMTLALAARMLNQGRVLETYSFDFKPSLTGLFSNTYATVSIDFSKVKWSVSGTLPTGMTLDPATGVLAGTPSTNTAAPPSGTALTVVASYKGMLASQPYTLNIASPYQRAKSVSAGGQHSCAVTLTDTVRCWGKNASGQLGNNTLVDSFFPVDVQGLPGPVASVSAGVASSCAILKTGALYCWGDNSFGQLGINSTTNSPIATQVYQVTSGATSVSTGNVHTCAVISGVAKCWGYNGFGGLGNNTTTQSNIPAAVSAPLTSGVAMIFAGNNSSCAVTTSGAAYCWGYNNVGQLGDGTKVNKLVPTAVSGITTGATYITLGVSHGCAVVSGGAKCWGKGNAGALGYGGLADQLTPVAVSGMTSGVISIQAFYSSTLAFSTDGTVKGWGSSGTGILGANAANPQTTPFLIAGFTEPSSAFTTGSSASLYPGLCAIAASSGTLMCWGPNTYGQLSQGNTTTSYTPIPALTAAW